MGATREDIDQIIVRIGALQAASDDDALDNANVFGIEFGQAERPRFFMQNILKVAKQLGHKDWSMLVRVYDWWIPEVGMKAGSAEKN